MNWIISENKGFRHGFFDGDGWITKRTYKQGWQVWQAGSASLSGQILQEMKAWINKIAEREFGSLFCRPSGCWQLDFSGKKSSITVLDLLYSNSTVYLNRKMNLYQEIKK